jgi:hypothetical protein
MNIARPSIYTAAAFLFSTTAFAQLIVVESRENWEWWEWGQATYLDRLPIESEMSPDPNGTALS